MGTEGRMDEGRKDTTRRRRWTNSLAASLSASLLPFTPTVQAIKTTEGHQVAANCKTLFTHKLTNTHIQATTHFLSREVVGGQQSSYETNVDLKHGHLGILGKQESTEKNIR